MQPGQLLALRTTIGLIATMEEITQREQEADPLGTSPSKGALKTARLQPLRRVTAPPQPVDQCLGIIPGTYSCLLNLGWRTATFSRSRPFYCRGFLPTVMMPRSTGERPRSSTIDPIDPSRRRTRTPAKRRSRSAITVPSASIESTAPRQLALVPQSRIPIRAPSEDQTLPSVTSVVNQFKVEVTIAKKSNEHHPGCSLPPIYNSMETQSPAATGAHDTLITADQDTKGKSKVCIISLANEVPEKPKSRGGHQSKRVTSGKLSLGWSPPKPLGPINGTSVPIAVTGGKRTQLHTADRNVGKVQEAGSSEPVTSSEPVHIFMDQTLSEGHDQTANPV